MTIWWPATALGLMVVVILVANRHPSGQRIFRWLPIPLWCYILPAIAVALGWLPRADVTYRALTDVLLPVALTLLLLGVDLPAVIRTSRRALLAMFVGAAGIILGAALGVCLLHASLPPEAWKGAGALAGTWTGGTMNLLALRALLEIPDAAFAPLILVDAMIAYGWMACLVGLCGWQAPINRWLRATAPAPAARSESSPHTRASHQEWRPLAGCLLIALIVPLCARTMAHHLPRMLLISSVSGWTVLLTTTAALGLSLMPVVRRLGARAEVLGYPSLYLVLAATAAQTSLAALAAAPAWILVGCVTVVVHVAGLVLAGRAWRIPLGTLATVSQANIGGVVSAPLVGAVYNQSLVPVGLLLAIAANALGTYLGWGAAMLCRWLLG